MHFPSILVFKSCTINSSIKCDVDCYDSKLFLKSSYSTRHHESSLFISISFPQDQTLLVSCFFASLSLSTTPIIVDSYSPISSAQRTLFKTSSSTFVFDSHIFSLSTSLIPVCSFSPFSLVLSRSIKFLSLLKSCNTRIVELKIFLIQKGCFGVWPLASRIFLTFASLHQHMTSN